MMSRTVTVDARSAELRERWAALDSQNERVVDASDPLFRELDSDSADNDQPPRAAS